MARATRRGADSSVSLGAPRQRHVRHETRCRPGGEPALCAPARAPVLLRDLHLAHHRQRPAGHRRACRSPTWGSPTRRLLEALLPSISTSVLRALQRAQQLPAKLRNRLGSSRFRLPGHCSNRCLSHHCTCPKLITPCVLLENRVEDEGKGQVTCSRLTQTRWNAGQVLQLRACGRHAYLDGRLLRAQPAGGGRDR